MTDVEGKTHRTTVPRGKLQYKVWKRLLARKAAIANPFFIELIGKIQEPFVSAISDFQGSRAVFHDGKVLLAGDAFNLCRPHGGGSTSQAAFQVEQLVKCWCGEMTLSEWEQKCVESAANAAQFSLKMAQVFWYKKVES
jgi:2-polyprenyl-6-methoxyphenol hydroxylase-like FAD-dependent oxidoreductase